MSNVLRATAPTDLVGLVAENVRVECARKGLTQSALARAMGWSPRTVNERWWGGRQWQLEDLEHVAAALGIPVGRLLDVARLEGLEPPTF